VGILVVRVIADAAEAENLQPRYLAGDDAHEFVALGAEDFERMIEESMKIPD